MKKNVLLGVWAFVLLIFETVICRYISIKGAYPSVVLAFVTAVAVLDDDITRVAVISSICGLILDCLNGGIVGVNLFGLGFLAVICNYITERFFMPNLFVMICCTAIGTLLMRTLVFALGFAIFGKVSVGNVFVPLILQYTIYTVFAGVIIYLLLKKMLYAKKTYDRR